MLDIDIDISSPSPAVDERAFEFENASELPLVIKVLNYKRNGNNYAFNEESLLSIGRPTELRLSSMTYINETVFRPFLDDHPNNKISIDGNNRIIDCNDCNNYWIFRDKLDNRVTYVGFYGPFTLCNSLYKWEKCHD